MIWHRNGHHSIISFAVTPHFDIQINKHSGRTGYDVVTVRIGTYSRETIGHTDRQGDAKTLAETWGIQAMVDYREAERTRAEYRAVEADALTYTRGNDTEAVTAIDLDRTAYGNAVRDMVNSAHSVAVDTRLIWAANLLKGHRAFALAGAENEAHEMDSQRTADTDAREAYAHAGYGVPLTAAEIGAGYVDWDLALAGLAPLDHAGGMDAVVMDQAYRVGRQRRAVLNRMAALGRPATDPALIPAGQAFADGQFLVALSLLSDDALKTLDRAERPQEREAVEVDMDTFLAFLDRPDRPAAPTYVRPPGYAQHGAPRADGSHAVWGLPYPTAGPCLRLDGPHVGHGRAVTDECTAEIHRDPYDAAAEIESSRAEG